LAPFVQPRKDLPIAAVVKSQFLPGWLALPEYDELWAKMPLPEGPTMRMIAYYLALMSFLPPSAMAGEIFFDSFEPPPVNEDIWCQCQIYPTKTPVKLWSDPKDKVSVATITVNDSSIGGKACSPDCPSAASVAKSNPLGSGLTDDDVNLPESLGPPLKIDKFSQSAKTSAVVADDFYCTDEIRKIGETAAQKDEDACSQRQELRLHKSLRFPSAEAQTYSLRFRMPKAVYDTEHSIRWITAQWKQEPVHEKKYLLSLPRGPSPVIAQRYDDGVLRVTVQSDLCRCVVAAATPTDINGKPWTDGRPAECSSIDATLPAGSPCSEDLDLTATYENGGVLVSPFRRWVEMKYVMKFTGGKDSFLEIHQDGKRIVKVTGVIGYTPHTTKRPMTKFKIGMYRDYIPQEDMIDVDWVRASVDEP
jgi:hypothetical protein